MRRSGMTAAEAFNRIWYKIIELNMADPRFIQEGCPWFDSSP
jgi:hypothetical protein